MTLFIECEEGVSLPIAYEALCKAAIEACIDYMKCPYETEINVLLTNNEVIQEINLQQRNIDKPTDVLSFPMIEWAQVGEFDFLEDSNEYFHPDSGELMLGDMILSVDKIMEQAHEYGHSLEREYTFLIVHSMLHLFGYDHMVEEERITMEIEQKCIMDIIGIGR